METQMTGARGSMSVRLLLLLGIAAFAAAAQSAEVWTAAAVVSTEVNTDGGKPRFATDRNSHWATVWQRSQDLTSLYSRSTNNANTWGAATELAEPSSFNDRGNPDVAAEITSGTFLAVWSIDNGDNDLEIGTAFSAPDQTTFTTFASPLAFNGAGGYEGLLGPRIASGGNHVWVTAASASNGTDEELVLFRSLNDGTLWQLPSLINQSAVSLGLDRNISIASDQANHWVTLWERRAASNPSNIEIFYSRSTDNGATWLTPANLNTTTPGGSQPVVAADTENVFVALYVQGTGASSLKAYRTFDGGATWTGPVAVNALGPAISDTPTNPDIACDGQASCVAVWSATPSGSSRKKLFYATSVNRGQSWSVADVLTTASVDATDDLPQIEYDGAGRWVAVWQRTIASSGQIQILSSKLVFPIRADLSVTQTDSPDPVLINGTVTYSLTVKNDGPSSATNVVLKDTLPTTASVSVTQSQGTKTETSGVVTLNIGTMAPGSVVTAQIAVKLTATGIYTNVASLTSTEPDTDTKDRVSTETTRVLVEGIDLQGEWELFEFDLPRRPYRGKLDLKTTINVSNLGTRHVGDSIMLLMFSDDEILSDDDAFVDAVRIELLKPGQTRLIKWKKTIRRRTPWYGRHLIAIFDAEKRHDEADETNNVALSEELPVP